MNPRKLYNIEQALFDALHNEQRESKTRSIKTQAAIDAIVEFRKLIESQIEIFMQPYEEFNRRNPRQAPITIEMPSLDVMIDDPKGGFSRYTALIKAVLDKDLFTVKALCQARANPDLPNNDGDTPLILAAKHWGDNLVAILLEAKASPDLTNPRSGFTPLQSTHSLECTRLLLEAKADPNKKNPLTWLATGLCSAIQSKDLLLCTLLLNANANPSGYVYLALPSRDDYVTERSKTFLSHLLDAKADPNEKYSFHSPSLDDDSSDDEDDVVLGNETLSLLDIAINRNLDAVYIQLLLNSKADPNLSVNYLKKTPLMRAAASGNLTNVQLLLEAKANTGTSGNPANIKYLLEAKANSHTAEVDSKSAQHLPMLSFLTELSKRGQMKDHEPSCHASALLAGI